MGNLNSFSYCFIYGLGITFCKNVFNLFELITKTNCVPISFIVRDRNIILRHQISLKPLFGKKNKALLANVVIVLDLLEIFHEFYFNCKIKNM